MFELISNSQQDTKKFAKIIANFLLPGDVLELVGELGAGKTTFTSELCTFLGVKEGVSSPSFALVHLYEGKMPVYHMDFYRFNHMEDLLDLDFERYFYPEDGISLIEWGSCVEAFLPDNRMILRIEIVDDTSRKFILEDSGKGKKIGEELSRCKF